MARLLNEAFVEGSFAGEIIEESSIFEVFTNAILVNKVADKTLWMDDDDLLYTITASNSDPSEPPLPVLNAVFRDTLDIDLIVLNTATLTLNGTILTAATDPANPVVGEYVYDPDTGLLTIPLGDLEAGQPDKVITFRVTKVA